MKNDLLNLQEGNTCPECKDGVLYTERQESCRCHISPPCNACTDAPLVCDKCDYVCENEKILYNENDTNEMWETKTPAELYDEMPSGVFDYIRIPLGGAWCEIRGKKPKNMTAKEIVKECGIDMKYGMPKFSKLDDSEFILTYCVD